MAHAWDAEHYLRFADARTLPALDLLSRIAGPKARRVVEYRLRSRQQHRAAQRAVARSGGYGPRSRLKNCFVAARRQHPGIAFEEGRHRELERGGAPCDVIFANASLQWVGDHQRLMPHRSSIRSHRAASWRCKMPRNHDFATHRLMREVAAEGESGADHLERRA